VSALTSAPDRCMQHEYPQTSSNSKTSEAMLFDA
jgi:hypothetical protein